MNQPEVMSINVNKSVGVRPTLYDATRCAWRLDPKRAKRSLYVLAEDHGTVIGVFMADEWLPATIKNFPDLAPHADRKGRFGFHGREAPPDILARYLGKKLERKRGNRS